MPQMKINPLFELGEMVYLKTDPDQAVRMITAIHINMNGFQYELTCADTEPAVHYAGEISREKVSFS